MDGAGTALEDSLFRAIIIEKIVSSCVVGLHFDLIIICLFVYFLLFQRRTIFSSFFMKFTIFLTALSAHLVMPPVLVWSGWVIMMKYV